MYVSLSLSVCLIVQGTFLFAMVWSVGASSGIDGRKAFNVLLREICVGPLLPKTKSVNTVSQCCMQSIHMHGKGRHRSGVKSSTLITMHWKVL